MQGEAIIANNLAGSSNMYNLADSVMAINMTTIADDVRYIKQLKSRYNEIQYHKDNVVAIKFITRPDGLKGFEFLNYEPEEELIKPIDRMTRADEDMDIINLIIRFGRTPSQIAEELKPKYAPDVEISTYKERIRKRIQRLRAKGRIPESETLQPIVEPQQITTTKNSTKQESSCISTTTIAEIPPMSYTERILKQAGINNINHEEEQDWKDLQADILRMQESPVKITDDYADIMPY